MSEKSLNPPDYNPPPESDIPKVARSWPPVPRTDFGIRIGRKCTIIIMPENEWEWLEVGGVTKEEENDENSDEPRGGVSTDTNQSRIYYRDPVGDEPPICRVLLPDDFHFRSSLKGYTKGRSKSFDKDRNPSPEILLLYALKTGSYDDRLRAVEAIESDYWCAVTFGQMFNAMDNAASTESEFMVVAGEFLAISARELNGLANWATWEKVADSAAMSKKTMLNRAGLKNDQLNHSLFIRAVKETTIEHRGLTYQNYVRKRWEDLGGRGEWREIRKTLGFAWLPEEKDWKKNWGPKGANLIRWWR